VSARPAVFLDRDGVLTELVPDPGSGLPESPLSQGDVRLVPGAAAAAKRLRDDGGYALVGVTNQPAAAKGRLTVSRLEEVQTRVVDLLAAAGVELDGWRMCLHHPDGVVAELSGRCECRKPAPGMLLDAARELALDLDRSWMVGDTDADIEAGRAAGCRTALIVHPGSAHKRSTAAPADLEGPDLDHVSALVLGFSTDRVAG
jgi:D-glycero-D-manno-heptose 1,7-bisphosphate phosphatase